jgi:electron transport complex protein RnfG
MEATQNKSTSIPAIALNLASACLVAGVIIAAVYFFTSPIAAEKNQMLKTVSMKALVKDADEFKPVEGKTDWYAAKAGGKIIAYIIPYETKGFGGKINLLVAVTPENTVLGYDVTSHNETPGLGDGITKDAFKNMFKGKAMDHLKVTKAPSDKEDIQALTGATISSRAVTDGIKKAVQEVADYTGGSK